MNIVLGGKENGNRKRFVNLSGNVSGVETELKDKAVLNYTLECVLLEIMIHMNVWLSC